MAADTFVLHCLFRPPLGPTREILREREAAQRWSSTPQLLASGEAQSSDASLLRTAKVMALRDPSFTYLLHFDPSELRLLQNLHELTPS